MRIKFNEEIKALMKIQTNGPGNEKLNKSNKKAQWKPSLAECNTQKTEY